MTVYTILLIVVAIFVFFIIFGFIFAQHIRISKNRSLVRYTFVSSTGDKVKTNWKTFDQGEYDNILAVHTHPAESTYIKTDHKGNEVIISIPYILTGRVIVEQK